ncbi:MAG: hypothetical protein H6718_12050 [Polyangiaceae bacterium]|nr:hypothetical protein [Myxococcales bacterium]MCB9586125.1 hypothetical protein [Polyangiaceae bacterium]MCB9606803.1 hypothetical protein [Polyangiaceae bacterium]
MKFMLMMHAPYGGGSYKLMEWPAKAIQNHIAFMKDFASQLASQGELIGAEGLAPPGDARVVKGDANGKPEVSDGPFAETKEFLVGYWVVDVETAERAHEIAAAASMAPGSDGEPLHLSIEVRQVMEAPKV